MKKPAKVPAMKLIPEETLGDILCDLFVIEDLLREIGGGEESGSPVNGIRHFLTNTARRLDKATTYGYSVRWEV